MRFDLDVYAVWLVVLLSFGLQANAHAKKSAKMAIAPAAAKPVMIGKDDVLEGRALNVDSAKIAEKFHIQEARVLDWRNRMERRYGVRFALGDSIDLETGEIQHKPQQAIEAPPPPTPQERAAIKAARVGQ